MKSAHSRKSGSFATGFVFQDNDDLIFAVIRDVLLQLKDKPRTRRHYRPLVGKIAEKVKRLPTWERGPELSVSIGQPFDEEVNPRHFWQVWLASDQLLLVAGRDESLGDPEEPEGCLLQTHFEIDLRWFPDGTHQRQGDIVEWLKGFRWIAETEDYELEVDEDGRLPSSRSN